MIKIFYVLIIFLFSSCAVSIGNAKKYLPEVNKFISEKKVLVFDFGDLDYISENNKYGRVVYEIPEITQNIVQTGTVVGYVQRPANEDNPEISIFSDIKNFEKYLKPLINDFELNFFEEFNQNDNPVSYTHLTLPTNREV